MMIQARTVVVLLIAGSLALIVSGKYSVAVIGGGVSGLTAAHELTDRGFDVQVYDRQGVFGGKARSYDVLGTGTAGRKNLPGEHGFRIFWNYYLNTFDTLSRIQYNQTTTVLEYMQRIEANELLTESGVNIFIDFGPENWVEFVDELRNLSRDLGFLSKQEMEFTIQRMEIMLTTSDERMRGEFEEFSFGQFVGSQYRSANFTKFWLGLMHLGGIDPNLAGLGPTINYIQGLNSPWDNIIAVKVLQRPTNEAWIDPWVKQMTSAGSKFYTNAVAQSFTCSGNAVTSVNVLDLTTGKVSPVKADYYIFAVPVDQMSSILQASNSSGSCKQLLSLQGISKLPTTWMGGMQYFLHTDVEITDGFALYLDSPWALSSVSLAQWWPDFDWHNLGDGTEKGVLSVIISNFTAPGGALVNKSANACTPVEIQKEVWAQLKAHLNTKSEVLKDNNVAGFSLETSLTFSNGALRNSEVMFYASPNSWKNSPVATTELHNMFVCGDYVQTLSRVTPTTMEAANESARRAVNALLTASSSSAKPCTVFPPPRNPDFAPARLEDEARYKLGLPHSGCTARGCVATS